MRNLFKHFELNQVEEGSFRFCGRVMISACTTRVKTILKILPISFVKGDRGPEAKATAAEIAQARSVIGSLAWIARQVRPDLCYQTSRLQSVVSTAQVKHLTQCNKESTAVSTVYVRDWDLL